MPHEILPHATLTGVGASAVLDPWGARLKRALGIAPLNLRMVGRWVGQIAQADSTIRMWRPPRRCPAKR